MRLSDLPVFFIYILDLVTLYIPCIKIYTTSRDFVFILLLGRGPLGPSSVSSFIFTVDWTGEQAEPVPFVCHALRYVLMSWSSEILWTHGAIQSLNYSKGAIQQLNWVFRKTLSHFVISVSKTMHCYGCPCFPHPHLQTLGKSCESMQTQKRQISETNKFLCDLTYQLLYKV